MREAAVACYYFDIYNGNVLCRDQEGQECDSPEAIQDEAMHALPVVAKEAIPRAATDAQAFTMLVRDRNNTTVYTATLTFAGLRLGDVPIPEHEPSD